MIAFALGPDALTAKSQTARLLIDVDPDGTSVVRLDGRVATVPEVTREITSVGFFGTKRVVVVDDLVARHHRPANDDSDGGIAHAGPPYADTLAELLASVPVEHVLILVEPSLSMVPAGLKRVLPADTRILLGAPPRGHDLLRWMVNRAPNALNVNMARRLADRLYPGTWSTSPKNPKYDRPPDLERISHEIDKLALFAHPGKIEEYHIDEMTDVGLTDRLFRFIEAVERDDVAGSIIRLDEMTTDESEYARIAAQLYQQGELTLLLDANAGKDDPTEVGRAVSLANPARMTGIARGRRSKTLDIAAQRARRMVDIERRTKRGILREPGDTLYQLITGAAQPIKAM